MFKGRRLCIATMHHKEIVLAPLLENTLGVSCVVPEINTDLFGTFSGEIERTLDPEETARQKCEKGMELTGCDLAVASEGSFGPHPVLGFIPCNQELMFFHDRKNNIEIVSTGFTTKTNFSHARISTFHELKDFAEKTLFPSHGLILKGKETIVKGINEWKALELAFEKLIAENTTVLVETDMRAMFNPTRMETIKACAEKIDLRNRLNLS